MNVAFQNHFPSSIRILRQIPKSLDCDKFFCVEWIDSSSVILGSKDSSIILWNVSTSGLPVYVPLPYIASKQESGEIYSLSVSPQRQEFIASVHDKIILYDIPTFSPLFVFSGHSGTVFDTKFLNEDFIVSGGRDGSIRIWNLKSKILNQDQNSVVRREHQSKIRALGLNRRSKKLVSVSPDSSIKVWDLNNLDMISDIVPITADEMTCISQIDQADLYAIGSAESLMFIDIRMASVVSSFRSKDPEGIRSLQSEHSVIITGGAGGLINFFDTRNMKYRESKGPCQVIQRLDTSKMPFKLEGYVRNNEILRNFFSINYSIKHAVFDLSISPNKTQIIAAGGPLTVSIFHSLLGLI